MLQFRDLTANTMNKLVRIPGIVISASVLSSRATKLHLQCRACRSPKMIFPASGMGGVGGGSDRGLPRFCDAPGPNGSKNECPIDPYLIIHSKSTFADQQTLKLQEAPDMVPVGELPRHMLLSADRYLTGKVVPGSRVIATGIYSTFQSSKNVRLRLHIGICQFIIALYRKVPALLLSDNPICASSILSYPPHQQEAGAQTLSVCSSHLKKKRNLEKWREVKASTNDSRRALGRVSMEALVRDIQPYSSSYQQLHQT